MGSAGIRRLTAAGGAGSNATTCRLATPEVCRVRAKSKCSFEPHHRPVVPLCGPRSCGCIPSAALGRVGDPSQETLHGVQSLPNMSLRAHPTRGPRRARPRFFETTGQKTCVEDSQGVLIVR